MLYMYAVYDRKAESFATPFFCKTNELAKRAFVDLCRDSRTVIAQHPADFELHVICAFDDSTGRIQDGHETVIIMDGVEAMVSAHRADRLLAETKEVADQPRTSGVTESESKD